MDNIFKKLKEYGADIEGITERFLGDVDLYKTCFVSFLNDESFPKLGEAINSKNYVGAFEYAHTLKGASGNMGLLPLYKIICIIVNNLRKNDYLELDIYYSKVIEQLSCLKQIKELI